jgi:hypothetical protein
LAVALLLVEKIRQSAALFWFGLRIVGFLFGVFGVRFGGKDRGLCPYNPLSQQVGGLGVFCMKWLRILKFFFKNSRSKLKNQKPIAVDVFYKAFPMIPL